MGGYANQIALFSVATISAATSTKGFDLAEYRDGSLIIFVQTLQGTGARVYANWSISPTATGPRSGRYAVIRSLATAIKATGLSAMTLTGAMMGKWARVSLSLGGTSPSSKVGAWIIARGQS